MRKLSPFELDQFDDEKEIQRYYERYFHDYRLCISSYNNNGYGCIEFEREEEDADPWADQPRYAAGNI